MREDFSGVSSSFLRPPNPPRSFFTATEAIFYFSVPSIFENRTQLPFPSANVQIINVNLFSDDFFRETRTGQTHFFFSSGRGVDKKGDKGGIDDERDKEKKSLRSKRCCWGGDGKRRKRLEQLLQRWRRGERRRWQGLITNVWSTIAEYFQPKVFKKGKN